MHGLAPSHFRCLDLHCTQAEGTVTRSRSLLFCDEVIDASRSVWLFRVWLLSELFAGDDWAMPGRSVSEVADETVLRMGSTAAWVVGDQDILMCVRISDYLDELEWRSRVSRSWPAVTLA